MRHLDDFSAGRDNNFNLLRFAAASAVLVSHSFALATGDPATEPLRRVLRLSLGDIAVAVFFVTSGFLVMGSLLSKRNAVEFFLSRALRIYPALWTAVLLTVLVFGLAFSELSAAEFFRHRGTWRYVATNMLMLGRESFELPGTFLHLPFARAVNGSLWSLPVEIRMYMALGFAWLVCKALGKAPVRSLKLFALAMLVAASAIDFAFLWTHTDTYQANQAPFFADLAAAFFAGATFRAWQHRIPAHPLAFAFALLALLLSAGTPWFLVSYKVLFAYVVLYVALVPKGRILGFNRFGDYSYGIYIYAFAVQQAFVYLYSSISPGQLLLVSFPVTLGFAVASWHLIERRALSLRVLLTRPSRTTVSMGAGAETHGRGDRS